VIADYSEVDGSSAGSGSPRSNKIEKIERELVFYLISSLIFL
jgi:hypothetical protein